MLKFILKLNIIFIYIKKILAIGFFFFKFNIIYSFKNICIKLIGLCHVAYSTITFPFHQGP